MPPMELSKVKELIKLLEESTLTEIEIQEDDQAIRISKQGAMPPILAPIAPPQIAVATATHAPAEPKDNTADPGDNYHTLKSPMVGTFYTAASPEAAPFAKIGDKVTKGQELCIIEAMKMMNHIEADVNGTIKDIMVENSEPVEFDQPLFHIET